MIVEVPAQIKRIPQAAIEIADKLVLIIRDTNGKVYNP